MNIKKIVLIGLIAIWSIITFIRVRNLKDEISYYREFYVWVADNHEDVYKEFFEPTEEQIRDADKEFEDSK